MRAKQVYAAIVVFLTLIAVGVLNVLYTQHVDRQADERNVQRSREICGLIRLVDDVNQRAPAPAASAPNAADIVAYRAELHRYRLALGC